MSLRVIDIASWQEGIVPSDVDCDAVIVKATGGTWYENPFFEEWADDVLESGRLLGIYHYAVESVRWRSAAEEAEFFIDHVRKYKGKFIPVLDWENDAMELSQEWALEWMRIVEDELGATPIFYAYASHLNSKSYDKVAASYPLWMASYLDRYINAGWVANPRNSWDLGSWDDMLMYQYTSTGRIDGYDGKLDLSVYYGTRSEWLEMCGTSPSDDGDDDEDYDGPSLREQVVEAARSQIGEPYYSMNYSESEGFNGWMGTNYIGQGWGCAQLCAYSLNSVLGTEYAGSVWNFAGDALGDGGTNQGGDFEFTNDPQPGDVVVYIAKGHNGEDAEDYSHAALYVGDDMVVGSWGTGKPGESGYWPGRGVSEDHISEQSLGNGRRVVSCVKLDEYVPPKRKRKEEIPYEGVGAVYRFNDGGAHFFTTSLDEARTVADWMDYEGVAFRVSGRGRDVYRLYDEGNSDHFLTTSTQERDRVRGWMEDEGVAFVTNGPIPVYRLCDESTNLHFYTASVAERDACAAWMRYEGVAFNVLSPDDSIEYAAHVQGYGWLKPVVDGMVAGTEGESKRLEALLIDPPKGFVLDVMVHVQRDGDKWYRGLVHGNTTVIGTTGQSKRVEGIRIDVKSRDNEWVGAKRLSYRAHVQKIGWSDWCEEGVYCGTKGKGLRVEAVQIRLT